VENLINAHIVFSIKYSEWVSNIVPVWKKNGDIQLCVYFCALNRASVKYNFPLTNMEMILQQVPGSQMMSLLDDFFGYNQIRVKRDEKYKTTFTTQWSTFVYEQIPFGSINASATFQRVMKITFHDIIGKIIHIFLDDLSVYSKNRQDHFYHIKKVFSL
jgi:hypothetical protein